MSPDKPKKDEKPEEVEKSEKPKPQKTFYVGGKKIKGEVPKNLFVPKSRDAKKKK